jgi:hypothetical protein
MVKISGPTSGQPTSGAGESPEVERSGGKGFVDTLGKTESTSGPAAAGQAPPPSGSRVAEIGRRLESGEITADDAVDEVVDQVLDDKLGLDASPDLRSKVEQFMREQLESDPLLVEKRKNLSA